MRTNIRNVRLRRISRLKPLLQCIAVIEITGFVGGASAPMAAGPFCFFAGESVPEMYLRSVQGVPISVTSGYAGFRG